MSTKDQDFLLHIKKINDSLNDIKYLMTDRNYVLVFSYFYPECGENHEKRRNFFLFHKRELI